MKLFQSKAFQAWAPVLAIVLVVIIAVLLLGGTKKAVAPAETASTTGKTVTTTSVPAAPSPYSGIGIGGVKSTTYAPTGWSLKFKLQAGWSVNPIRNSDGTVAQVSIGTSAVSMSVLKEKPFGKPAQKTPVMSTKTILGKEVEVATYDGRSFFTVRYNGDDYNFSVEGGLDAFIASIQAVQ